MKGSWGSLKLVVPLLLVLPVGYRATNWFLRSDPKLKFDAATSQAGRDLFMHEWTAGDALASGGDGLGPVFNAASCVACHRQSGRGAGAPSRITSRSLPASRRQITRRAKGSCTFMRRTRLFKSLSKTSPLPFRTPASRPLPTCCPPGQVAASRRRRSAR